MKLLQSAMALLFSLSMNCVAAAQDKKLATINVGYSALSGSFAPLWVGYDHGLFAKHGLDLKMAYIQGNRVMLAALTAEGDCIRLGGRVHPQIAWAKLRVLREGGAIASKKLWS